MARRSGCLIQLTVLSFEVWLALNKTAAEATTCDTKFTPAIQAKVWRPKGAFLQEDPYAF